MRAPAAAARYGERVIVGIDETGDFRDGSRAWFAAALIRPSGYVAVEAALRGWERRTRRRLGLANEIKGAPGAEGSVAYTATMSIRCSIPTRSAALRV